MGGGPTSGGRFLPRGLEKNQAVNKLVVSHFREKILNPNHKFMILIYAVVLGIILYITDFVAIKLSKQKFSIIDSIENFIDKFSGKNIWIRLLIVLGTPFLSFYLAYNLPEDSFGYWMFMILGLVSVGYLGVSWLETSNFSTPTPKVIMLFAIGLSIWILGDKTGAGLASGNIDISNDISIALGWIFVVVAFIVYRKAQKTK